MVYSFRAIQPYRPDDWRDGVVEPWVSHHRPTGEPSGCPGPASAQFTPIGPVGANTDSIRYVAAGPQFVSAYHFLEFEDNSQTTRVTLPPHA